MEASSKNSSQTKTPIKESKVTTKTSSEVGDDSTNNKSKSPNKKKVTKDETKEKGNKSPIGGSKKRRIAWAKNIVKVTEIESYKKYNLENCHEDPGTTSVKEKIKCSCSIF